MNGGVSLAVWMGGVTLELYRLAKEDDDLASKLSAVGAPLYAWNADRFGSWVEVAAAKAGK